MSEEIKMNIEKADYGTIVKFGTLKDLYEKIKLKDDNVSDIINWVDDSGMSILERSLVSRKFEISKFLLDNNAKVNIVSKEGNNEFHFLAPNINCIEAVEIGKLLLSKGTSVMQKDVKYGNTAFFSLCMEAFKERSESTMNFIEECFEQVTDVDEKNKNGFSIRKLIMERGSDELKKRLEEKYAQHNELRRFCCFKEYIRKKRTSKWCFREESVNNIDNGWRFLSEIDTDEFLADSKNMVICDWGTIFEIEPAIAPIFELPIGTELTLEYDGSQKYFVNSETGEKIIF